MHQGLKVILEWPQNNCLFSLEMVVLQAGGEARSES